MSAENSKAITELTGAHSIKDTENHVVGVEHAVPEQFEKVSPHRIGALGAPLLVALPLASRPSSCPP
jgi:hypothetical protein